MGPSKKANDATRQERKAKKRKLEDAVPDLPGDNDSAEMIDATSEKAGKKRKRDVDAETGLNDEEKERKKRTKEEKRRRREEAEAGETNGEARNVEEGKKETKSRKAEPAAVEPNVEVEGAAVEGLKKSKKERKAERRAKEAAEAAKNEAPVVQLETTVEKKANEAGTGSEEEEKKKSKKNNRNREKKRKGTSTDGAAVKGDAAKAEGKDKKDAKFICFIGNLPFTANTESITKHFAAVKPISVRALTQKDEPTKSKGVAFVEFGGYDHMKTCLKLFHHSMFDDGLSAPRKINVELTAGGGGNTQDRRAKIKEKNSRLTEQRARRIQEEAKAKLEKSSNAKAIDESAIHPSRRTRVPGA